MFFEAMEEVLPDLKVIIDEGNGVQKVIPLEPFMEMNEAEENADQSDSAQQNDTDQTNTFGQLADSTKR